VRAFVVLKMKSKKGPKQRSKKNATMTSKIEEIKVQIALFLIFGHTLAN
jgi:hypothetical protein